MSKRDDVVDEVLADIDFKLETWDPQEAIEVLEDLIDGLKLRIDGLEEDLK